MKTGTKWSKEKKLAHSQKMKEIWEKRKNQRKNEDANWFYVVLRD